MSTVLTVEVSDEVYRALMEVFREETSQRVSELLKDFLEEQSHRLQDPIFEPITAQGSGIVDISEHHDRYLYGG